jgi:hypothetical protein
VRGRYQEPRGQLGAVLPDPDAEPLFWPIVSADDHVIQEVGQ